MTDNSGLTRRTVLGTIGGISLVAFAGCSSDDESGSSTTGTSDQTTTEGATGTGTGTEAYGSNAGSNALGFEIDYSGEWRGTITTDGQQQSIDGYGTREGNITPPPDYAAITAQKEEERGELTVKFFYDGEVVQSGSTRADYGTVTISVTY
jgi:hypothetical protein